MESRKWVDYPKQDEAILEARKVGLSWYEVSQVVSRFGPQRTSAACMARARNIGLEEAVEKWKEKRAEDEILSAVDFTLDLQQEVMERKVRQFQRMHQESEARLIDAANLVERIKDVLVTVEPGEPWVPLPHAGPPRRGDRNRTLFGRSDRHKEPWRRNRSSGASGLRPLRRIQHGHLPLPPSRLG